MWDEDLESEESEEEVEINPIKKFKRKSHNFPPLNQNPALALFVRQITREIEKLKENTIHQNLNTEQRLALKSLKNNAEIPIKASDKGGNIALMDIIDYRNMCLRILKNTQCYRKISPSLVERYNQEFYSLVNGGSK